MLVWNKQLYFDHIDFTLSFIDENQRQDCHSPVDTFNFHFSSCFEIQQFNMNSKTVYNIFYSQYYDNQYIY